MPPPPPWQAPPPPNFGPPSGPPAGPPPFGQPPVDPAQYGQPYGQPPMGQPPMGQPPVGPPPQWGQQPPPQFGAPPGYPPPQFGQYGPGGPGGPFGPPPPKSRKGLVIGLVSGGVVLVVLVVLGVVGLASLAGGGKPGPSASGSGAPGKIINGGTVTTTLDTDLTTGLMPADAADTDAYSLVDALYTGLVKYDAKTGKPVDVIADSITTSDAKTWTIKLKRGWTFDNGEAVDANAFIRSWSYAATSTNEAYSAYQFNRIAGYDQLAASSPRGTTLSGLSAPDQYTLTVTLTAPYAWFGYDLGEASYRPMAKACTDNLSACKSKPIGDGPFKMSGTWSTGGAVTLVRNDGYHGTKAHLDKLVFQPVNDIQKGVTGFQAGTYDVLPSVTGSTAAQFQSSIPKQVVSQPSLQVYYFGFPIYQKAYADKRVRQAFSEALDRKALAMAAGGGTPLTSFAPTNLPGAPAADSCTHCASNVADAKKLLAAAKFKGPIQLAVPSTSGGSTVALVQAACQQLTTNLGLQCTVSQTASASTFYEIAQSHKMTVPFRLPWLGDIPSAEEYLSQQFGSKGAYNYFGYANATVDKAIAAGDGAATPDAATTGYQPAWAQLDDDMPAIPLYQGTRTAVWSAKTSGVTLDAVGGIDFAAVGRLG
jgi:ABC-type oligopeptide transport system substrate-binding subunit